MVNNKIYIGKHVTQNLSDSYMGSGKVLGRAVRKYGKDKFVRELLYDFNTEDKMDAMERSIVDTEFLSRKDVYNVRPGGIGGFTKKEQCLYACGLGGKANALKRKSDPEFDRKYREAVRNGCKKAYATGELSKKKSEIYKLGYATGRIKPTVLSKEHYSKLGRLNSKLQTGSGNSRYGTKWIYNPDTFESKSVSKSVANEYIEKEGWVFGRKMK